MMLDLTERGQELCPSLDERRMFKCIDQWNCAVVSCVGHIYIYSTLEILTTAESRGKNLHIHMSVHCTLRVGPYVVLRKSPTIFSEVMLFLYELTNN